MKSIEQSVEPETGDAAGTTTDSVPSPSESSLPGVFLMTNSFETGGSERQFVTLARCLDPAIFRVHLGCIARKGVFQAGFGQVPEFWGGGRLYGFTSWKTRRRLTTTLST